MLPSGTPHSARGLLAAVSVAVGIVALSDLFAVFAGARITMLIDEDQGFAVAPQRRLDAAYSLYESAGDFQSVVYLPCAIVFVVWFFWTRRNTGLLAPDRFSKGPGWAIGAWLIPLVNLWLPYRIAVDMWGAATPLPTDGEPYRASIWPVNLWWGLFVSSTLFRRYAASRYESAEALTEIRAAVTQYMAADVLSAAAAVAAVYFAVRLTSMYWRKATASSPYSR
ncbi:hypothetical protein AQJ84_00330 [Streptomyces resistomycificus]|uniref:DUF4328 domain-containing protein n=2 Tax=Streptomyces resistomycificus TaxID=67356 RepID=A0A0L8KXG7_9ACTN|nr:hypothetical protein ADK37_33890 [Streptomyces resistomycificus]KUO02155.1 hypothetical protein AQJ84_00330 [Streptomyces resistomycificus]